MGSVVVWTLGIFGVPKNSSKWQWHNLEVSKHTYYIRNTVYAKE